MILRFVTSSGLLILFLSIVPLRTASQSLRPGGGGLSGPRIAARAAAEPASSPAVEEKLARTRSRGGSDTPAVFPACDPHPGTVVCCELSLQEAINAGLVELSSKGGIYGDNVTVTIDNQTQQKCDVINVKVFVEFWGTEKATAGQLQNIKTYFESVWNGHKTTSGIPVRFELITPPGDASATPRNSTGFHQVQLVDVTFRDVVYGMGTTFDINRGTGSGEWDLFGGGPEVYGHECGHFMMFPDFYTEFDKLPDSTWQNQKTNAILNQTQMAQEFIRYYPTWTLQQRINYLRVHSHVSVPDPGYEDDIMGKAELSSVKQWEIDALAAKSEGILIRVKPGTVLVPKNGSVQNFTITHREDIYVPKGQKKTCGGLFAACIDRNSIGPTAGQEFDLAPPLDSWPSNDAAAQLLKLLAAIDSAGYYDGHMVLVQEAIWRLTNNYKSTEPSVQQFLRDTGIPTADTVYNFPRLTNPAYPDSTATGTGFILPQQLVMPHLAPRATLTQVGTGVRLSGAASYPSIVDSSVHFAWSMAGPDSSRTHVADPSSDNISFTPDVRGLYIPVLNVSQKRPNLPARNMPVRSDGVIVAADARTETFEQGQLRGGAPFFWGTNPDYPWSVSDSVSFTGGFAARSVNNKLFFTSDLATRFSLPDSGKISFAFRAGSGWLVFSIDGRPAELRSDVKRSMDWEYATFAMGPGTHTVMWTFYGGNADSTGSFNATGAWLDDVFFPPKATLIRTPVESDQAPAGFSLSQNYPNPFTDRAEIRYTLGAPGHVTLILYDALGHELRRLADGPATAGAHSVLLKTAGLAPGIYYYRLCAGNSVAGRKMVVMR